MEWYNGDIADAIKLTKEKNSIFVVYVEGKDENSKKFASFVNDSKIRSKLESDKFVAVRIESGSENYMQFARIYQIVPSPSIFFIGKNGTPLEIGTCALDTIESLENMIDRALKAFSVDAAPANKALESSVPSEDLAEIPHSSSNPILKASESFKNHTDNSTSNIKESGESIKINKKNEPTQETIKNSHDETGDLSDTSSSVTPANLAARVEETRKVLELKRRERIEELQRLEKEREKIKPKDTMSAQQWQKEQELKELKDNIRRERREEQEARQRILEKIASDRAERAQKFATDNSKHFHADEKRQQNAATNTTKSLNNCNTSRLHFRMSNGTSKTHVFNNNDTFDFVRTFVQMEIIPETLIREFTLATVFPKREFTIDDDIKTLAELNLCPSAVILVISKQNSPATIAHSERIINTFNIVFWALVSPILTLFDYFRNRIMGGGDNTNSKSAQKRASNEEINPNDRNKKSNSNRVQNPSTSRSARNDRESSGIFNRNVTGRTSNIHRLSDNHDSDDENATWNGNSTQQQ